MEAVRRKAESGRIGKITEEPVKIKASEYVKKTNGKSFIRIHFDKHHE
jgi:hypothetical protein